MSKAITVVLHQPYMHLLHPLGLKRTRDPAILETCDIVVDVGGVYDEKAQRFDHHQRGFTEVFGHGFDTKLSSAGLVYKCVTAFHPLAYASSSLLPCYLQTLWERNHSQPSPSLADRHQNRDVVA